MKVLSTFIEISTSSPPAAASNSFLSHLLYHTPFTLSLSFGLASEERDQVKGHLWTGTET